jgi:hypothetical protein
MDMSWITERIGLGGAIWNARNMEEVARAGVTHILDMQIEFDDSALAEPHGIRVFWNPTDDDFLPKPPELLERGVEFALEALESPAAQWIYRRDGLGDGWRVRTRACISTARPGYTGLR